MTTEDLLGSAIAVVYDSLSTPGNFSAETLRGFLRPPLYVNPSMDSFRVMSHRDQVEVLQSPYRTEVRDLSWNVEEASQKLPGVLTGVLGLLGDVNPRSYEIIFFFEQEMTGGESPGDWLGQRFLRDELRGELGTGLSCDLMTLSYREGSKSYSIDVEVVGESRFMFRAYVSEPVDGLLSSDELRVHFGQERQNLISQLIKIGIK